MSYERLIRKTVTESPKKKEATKPALPPRVDINAFYRAIDGQGDISADARIALLCFYLFSSGVSLKRISEHMNLHVDTIRMYVERMQLGNPDSVIGRYRAIYDHLGFSPSPIDLSTQTAYTSTPGEKQDPVSRARRHALKRNLPTREDVPPLPTTLSEQASDGQSSK